MRYAPYVASNSSGLTAERILAMIVGVVRANLPDGVEQTDLDAFLTANQAGLITQLSPLVGMLGGSPSPAPPQPVPVVDVPEHWTASKRTAANLAALEVLAGLTPGQRPTPEQVAKLSQYSGWGGLSIQKVRDRLPMGLPEPEDFGLIHEYYTPSKVWSSVASTIPRLMPSQDGPVRALEPSAGIGRALRAFIGKAVRWTAVEYSALSARMLGALFPDATVFHGPFERWVAQNHGQSFDLIVANPPYGVRNGAASEDPLGHRYKTSRAYLYFLRRGLDLLRPGGIGVYVIPTGFLRSDSPEFARVRREVLLRHHLLAAFRLPSQAPKGQRKNKAVYDQFPTDILFFQARGGKLAALPAGDAPLLEREGYFKLFPEHILGEEIGSNTAGWEPGQKKSRRGYQVVGTFEALPDFTPRPMQSADGPFVPEEDDKPVASRGGLARTIKRAKGELTADLAAAEALGLRADALLAGLAKGDASAVAGWGELRADLLAWRQTYGNPQQNLSLARLASQRITGAERFLALWTASGLIPALQQQPTVEIRYQGAWTLPAVADWLYRQRAARLTTTELMDFFRANRHPVPQHSDIEKALLPAGWFLDGEGWNQLVPERDYLTGFLWPRYDRAKARADGGDAIAARQIARLREVIGWRSGPDILKECLPIDTWLPLDLVAEFISEAMQASFGAIKLVREDGLLRPEGMDYAALDNTDKDRTPGLARRTLSFIGWSNLDKKLWNPKREKVIDPETGRETREKKAVAQERENQQLVDSWRKWLLEEPSRLDALEETYNRQLRGYVPPTFPSEPLPVARWSDDIRLYDYQNRAARRIIENRSGLLAFDTGLGKTYTGIATLAAARQQGWARRPVVVVPNSIVWKWFRDIKRCLPDYRVLVVGSERYYSKRKKRMAARNDTPEQRAEKWTRFQAGEADVVLMTYSALSRTKIDPAFLQEYVSQTIAIRRSIAMAVSRDLKPGANITERREAEIKARVQKWLSEVLSAPRSWKYDPGIDWHALGVDLLMVDEAQNFKNLFHSARNGEKTDTKRAWALDFRCASVRAHSGGAGVILLSATPAKNDPVEFYNLLHYLHPEVWHQVTVDNHEAFLNRFGDYTKRRVPDASGSKLVEREVMTRFKNLDELRSVVYRWAEFKVAEDVGLQIPDAVRHTRYVELSDNQLESLKELFSELADVEEKLEKVYKRAGGKDDKQTTEIIRALQEKKRGLNLKVYLTNLHPDLPGIGGDKDAIAAANMVDAPKLHACAEEIMRTSQTVCNDDGEDCLDCGHIIFVENTAVHTWMRKILVEHGVPEARIAVLNAKEAGDLEQRQQISEGFNGVGSTGDEDHEPPKYDIVIANNIAYEGMDLQRRTCAIHHLDVPWDPSTLQQRNGRGVRQGNKFAVVGIYYYFVQGSNELQRVERIERKRGWMASLVSSQARDTNTTLSDDESISDIEDLAMRYASEEDKARIIKARAEREAKEEAEKKLRAMEQANRGLRDIDALFRRADRETEPERAGVLRADAEQELTELLGRFPDDLWDGADWKGSARRVRETSLFVPLRGVPLMPGDHLGVRSRAGADPVLVEVASLGKNGREDGVWLRRRNQVVGPLFLNEQTDLTDDQFVLAVSWKADDEAALLRHARQAFVDRIYDIDEWRTSGWGGLSSEMKARIWPTVQAGLIEKKRIDFSGWLYGDVETMRVPVDVGGTLTLLKKGGVEQVPEDGRLIPPTVQGWSRFLVLAQEQGGRGELSWSQLDNTSRFWWQDRRFPRGFFSGKGV